MNPTIEELTAAVEREAKKRPEALRLMTHPGVGPLTALAYVLIIGTPTRIQRSKQIGTYVGMIPCASPLRGRMTISVERCSPVLGLTSSKRSSSSNSDFSGGGGFRP
jgi:hypothetical protein